MRCRHHILAWVALLAVAPVAQAQVLPPSVAPVPEIIIRLPGVSIDFDVDLNPFQGTPGAPLSQEATQITQSHNFARQQVRYALQYLSVHRNQILAGEDENYNDIFGRFYDTDPETNPFLGEYEQEIESAILESELQLVTADDPGTGGQGGGGGGGGGGQGNNAQPRRNSMNTTMMEDILVSVDEGSRQVDVEFQGGGNNQAGLLPRFVKAEMFVYIGEPNDASVGGEVHQIQFIDGDESFIIRDPASEDFEMVHLHRVISFARRPNRSHYNQVVRTFERVRDLLELPATYNGAYDAGAFNQVFGAGNAVFDPFNDVVQREYGMMRMSDRAFRQAGFTNSDSSAHLTQLETDPLNRMAWTEDIGGADGNPFWDNALTIFSDLEQIGDVFDPDPMNAQVGETIQYVGGAFRREQTEFAGDFHDDSVAVTDAVIHPVTDLPIEGTGDPITDETDLKQWQMIIQSFAENDTDLTTEGTAAFGVMDIQDHFFPEGTVGFLENKDAANFAKFAALFLPIEDGGIGSAANSRPPGKNAVANFFPVVPSR